MLQIFLSALFVVFVAAGTPSTTSLTELNADLVLLPNIEAFVFGYDAVRGNPLSDNADPGYTSEIFELTYAQNRSVGIYAVPDNSSALTLAGCSSSGDYSLSSNGNDFQTSMLEGGSISFDPSSIPILSKFIPSFSTGSPQYKSMFEQSGSSSFEYSGVKMECASYEVSLDPGVVIRPLRAAFVAMVATIVPSDTSTLYAFTNAYGTHFLSYVMFGGNSFFYSVLERDSYYALKKKGVDIETGTDLEKYAALRVDVSDDPGYSDYTNVTHAQANWIMNGIPVPAPPCAVPPCAPGDMSAWAALVQLPTGRPQPIRVKLSGIFDLLTNDFFPDDPLIDAKRLALIAFLNNDYCGMVPGCGLTDPYAGVIAWFEGLQCPTNWVQYEPAAGRVLLSVMNATDAGISVNDPLADTALPPAHLHAFSGAFNLHEQQMALSQGGSEGFANPGSVPFSGTTGHSSAPPGPGTQENLDFTYMQLLLCRYTPSGTSFLGLELPIGSITYFDATADSTCPTDWVPFSPSDGRVLVPSNVTGTFVSQDAPVVAGSPFTHTHSFSVSWAPPCRNFVADNSFGSQLANCDESLAAGTVEPANNYIPYISAITCSLSDSSPSGANVPPGLLIFTSSFSCPPGWLPIHGAIAGHYLVAVTDNGSIQAVGSSPIPPGNSSYTMAHSHVTSTSVMASGPNMAGTDGGGNSWATTDDTQTSGNDYSFGTSGGVPYVLLLMCRQNVTGAR